MIDIDRVRVSFSSQMRSELPQDGYSLKSLVNRNSKIYFWDFLRDSTPVRSLAGEIMGVALNRSISPLPGFSNNLVGYHGRSYSLSHTRNNQTPVTISYRRATSRVERCSKVAEDYKDRFLTKKKDIKMSVFESIITCENAAFYKAFMTEWNSGSCSRDYESYCRQLRQSLSMHNYFRTKDFVVSDIDKAVNKIEQYILSKGWQIVFGSEKFFWFMYVLDNVPVLFGEAKFSDNLMSITFEGDKVSIVEAMSELTEHYRDAGIKVSNLLSLGTMGENIKISYVFPDEKIIAKPYFYPWLKDYAVSLEELIDDYVNSNKSVLLLIGPPGMGKSTFIRSVLFRANKEYNYLCSNERVLVSDGFIPWLAGLENKSMIAIEDADNFVASREKDGNTSMSGLLNTADGVIPRKNKIIISTNLPTINRVDPALVRPGRCHRVLEFRNLTYKEACHVREMEGLSVFETPSKKEYSLAEVLCGNDLADIKARKCASIGF